jgi:hypothetical protein
MGRFVRGGFASLALATFSPFVSWGSAQTAQQLGTVVAPEVTLRANPKADAPDAGRLLRGVDVIVHHAEGEEWLAIQPPPGTISWINHKFVAVNKERGFPQNAVVHVDGEVKLAAGNAVINQPLPTRKTSVVDGTIVRIIAKGVVSEEDGSTWYPIQPVKDDFRYVPRSSLQLGSPTVDRFVVKSPSNNLVPTGATEKLTASIPAPSSYPNKPAGWPNTNATWVAAEAAEQANDLDKAEKLYFQIAKEANTTGGDADLADLCYKRIHAIRERRRNSQGLRDPNSKWSAKAEETPGGKSDPRSDEWTRRNDLSAAVEPKADSKADLKANWTGAGVLRLASIRSGNKQYYALEDQRGNLLYYAVAGNTGIDLEKYLKKKVDLFGTTSYPQELKVGVVTVTRVDQVR